MKSSFKKTDPYVNDVLCNSSLEDLAGEKWVLIEGFENYAISNYGRIKSLERWTLASNGKRWKEPERIMKPVFVRYINKYLHQSFYYVHCTLSLENRKYRKSVSRLVYYHFVSKFDMDDRSIVISSKDDNRLHTHSQNLEKISASERRFKTFRMDRARNRKVDYQQAVSQYTVYGDLVTSYGSIEEAGIALGLSCESIMHVIDKEFITAGGFRWFLRDYVPGREDFTVGDSVKNSDRLFNTFLWEKLGKPAIDKTNPPGSMNLSLEDLPGEKWKPVPGFEDGFVISNKGRVKRLGNWTVVGRKCFLQEQILYPVVEKRSGGRFSLYCLLNYRGTKTRVTITRLLYYCFVEEFDLRDKTLVVVNGNEPLWNMDPSKLSLESIYSILKGKGT